MLVNKKISVLIVATAALWSCKKAYTPDAVLNSVKILVVEGFVNAGNDSTFYNISRSVKLSEGVGTSPEKGAEVTIEGNDGSSVKLTEISEGRYAAAPINADSQKEYRIRIKSAGQEYLSDYVPVKLTPEIDNLNFKIGAKNLDIGVSTHDSRNDTRYYRWSYEETWEFNANYLSQYISNGTDTVVPRPSEKNIYHCWNTLKSTSILLGSSAKISEDIITNAPLLSIPGENEKLSVRYSILVKQFALTKDGFDFWQNLKKNTEQLGSIFDALPSQVKGNIYCVTNPKEVVMGYFSVCTVASQRRYIGKNELLKFISKPAITDCSLDTALLAKVLKSGEIVNEEITLFGNEFGPLIPLDAIYESTKLLGHSGTRRECADCTLRGTSKRPEFWEN